MTRKHFQMIANVVKNINPRFDISRFVGACNSYATPGTVEIQF